MSENIEQVYVANPITSNAATDLMYFGQSPYGSGNDAAMTYANFAAQFGVPYTPAALTEVNDTNVTLTLGGTPTTALLKPVSITAGWNGLLSIARGGTGVGSVTTAPAATKFAGWDANSNLSANNFIYGTTSTTASATTLVLTVASTYQQVITGSTNQILQLPVSTTLAIGQPYLITNNATSGNIVTVVDENSNTIIELESSQTTIVSLLNTAPNWLRYDFLYGSSASNNILLSGTAGETNWSTSTYPATNAVNTLLYASSANVMGALATANNGVLITSNSGAPSWLANSGTAGYVLSANASSPPSWQAISAIGGTTSVTGDSGSATPLSGAVIISGGTTGLTTSGTSHTLSLTGTLGLSNGGTAASLTATAGGITYSTASALALTTAGTSGQLLKSAGTSAPGWTTNTYPSTDAQGDILYASAANTISGLAIGSSGNILTVASGVPAWTTATYPSTTTVSQLLYSSSANVIGGITTANDAILITSNTGVPSWLANGSAGTILKANSGAPPSWVAVSGSGAITAVAANSGSVTPSAGAITISGGTTGLTTSGSAQTVSLTGTLIAANGGTGITSLGTGIATALGTNLNGTGAFAGTTSPTFVTPVLGAASATSMATAPPASSLPSLVVGTAYQNTAGYDVMLTVYLSITAATTATIKLGVGATSTPTQQTIVASFSTAALMLLPIPIYIPNNYYALLSTTGTIADTISGQILMPI
jgi:hypothetical protein